MKVAIYGIFKDEKCVYVGRTQDPKKRKQTHIRRFGADHNFIIFKQVSLNDAARAERELINAYHAINEANGNGHIRVQVGDKQIRKLLRITKETQRTLTEETNRAIDQYESGTIAEISPSRAREIRLIAKQQGMTVKNVTERLLRYAILHSGEIFPNNQPKNPNENAKR